MEPPPLHTSGNDLRLAHVVILNAIALASAWRFARRHSQRDPLSAIPYALTLYFLIQYLSVTLPGLLGFLNRWTISASTILLSLSAHLASPRPKNPPQPPLTPLDLHVLLASIVFLAAYLAAIIHTQWLAPVLSDDALTYHLPAAIRWLQTGRLVLHETWFFNPANTYSPLAGSAFAAWWFAPMTNDFLARFLQIPPLILIFFASLALARLAGATIASASLIALAAVISRSFISQLILAKDDLYLAAFFLAAILAAADASDRFSPFHLGVSLGLILATKITAILAAPILLLLSDAPFRAAWRLRHLALASSLAVALAAPWFLRNWLLTRNPLYPTEISLAGFTLFPGLFLAQRTLEIASINDLWRIITTGYFQFPVTLVVPLFALAFAALALMPRSILRNPLHRALLLGPPLGLLLYALATPFAEVRFLNPAFLILMLSPAVFLAQFHRRPALCLIIASAILLSSIASSLTAPGRDRLLLVAILCSLTVPPILALHQRWPRLVNRALAASGILAALLAAMAAYVHFDPTVSLYAQLTPALWETQYGPLAQAWTFVRNNIPHDKILAYTNTYYIYPLQGFTGSRIVLYAPTRHNISALHKLPPLHRPVPGEQLRREITLATFANPDPNTWLHNLDRLRADYLFVATDHSIALPPELLFAAANPDRFHIVFKNNQAIVYSITRPTTRPSSPAAALITQSDPSKTPPLPPS